VPPNLEVGRFKRLEKASFEVGGGYRPRRRDPLTQLPGDRSGTSAHLETTPTGPHADRCEARDRVGVELTLDRCESLSFVLP